MKEQLLKTSAADVLSFWKKKTKKKTSEGGGGVAKTCLETNQLVASFVNTRF